MIELSCPLGAMGLSRNSYVEIGGAGCVAHQRGGKGALNGNLSGRWGSCGAVESGVARTNVMAAIVAADLMAGRWFDAIFAVEPMFSLVYPKNRKKKRKSKCWRGLRGTFPPRPSKNHGLSLSLRFSYGSLSKLRMQLLLLGRGFLCELEPRLIFLVLDALLKYTVASLLTLFISSPATSLATAKFVQSADHLLRL